MNELYQAAWHTEIIQDILQGKSPHSVLDIGCGMGVMTNFLANAFPAANVVGIDKDQEKIHHARELYPEIKFEQANALDLPFKDESFNCVIIAHVMHHVSFNERKQAIKEMHRILKKGGKIVILELNPWHFLTRKEFYQEHAKNEHMLDPVSAWRLVVKKAVIKFFWQSKNTGFKRVLNYLPFAPIYAIIYKK